MREAVMWWLTLQLLGLAALPLAFTLFRSLPDRGYSTARVLGLLLVGWLAYTLAMTRLVPFGRLLLLFCVLALVGFSAWLLLREDRALLAQIGERFRTPAFVRYVIFSEALFGLAYTLWAVFRAYNPEILNTEKFMDFGLMNAILKSENFPPNDMWLSGHSINYYYFGYLLMAALTSLSGVPSEIGFNLANVSLFSLTALGTFGLVFNLISGALGRASGDRMAIRRGIHGRASRERRQKSDGRARKPTKAAAGGRTGHQRTAVAQASATATAIERPVRGLASGGRNAREGDDLPALEPGAASDTFRDEPFKLEDTSQRPFYLSPYIFALIATLMVVAMGNLTVTFAKHDGDTMSGNGWRFCPACLDERYDWFAPSRIIQDYRTTQVPGQPPLKEKVGAETINEFPAFSFLLGDMHPHVMALPLVLLALSAAYAVSRRTVPRGWTWRAGLPYGAVGWTGIAIFAIVLGALYATNTWDYPTYTIVYLGGLALPYLASGREGGWSRAKPWSVQAGLTVALSLLAFISFHLTFRSFAVGGEVRLPESLADLPVIGWLVETLGRFVLPNTADKTITGFVVIFGVFLLALVVWLGVELKGYVYRAREKNRLSNRTLAVVGVSFLVVVAVALLLQFPLLGLFLPLSAAAIVLLLREPERQDRSFALLLFAVGAIIGLAVEIFFLQDLFGNRMNTLFKFYYQIWVLWSVAGGFALWHVLDKAFANRKERDARGRVYVGGTHIALRSFAVAWASIYLLLVTSGLMYSVYAPISKIGPQPVLRGLDGTAYQALSAPDDYAAVRWIKANVNGGDVVLECCRDEYNTGGHAGRVSSFTGVPTLLAWDGHEQQWRAGQPELLAEIGARRRIVSSIYQGTDPDTGGPLSGDRLLELLRTYDVDYVFVGAVERGKVDVTGKFPEDRLTAQGEAAMRQVLDVAFSSGETVIYRVPRLPSLP